MSKRFLVVILFLSSLLVVACSNKSPTASNNSCNDTYVSLEYAEFMKQPYDIIARNLAEALGVTVVSFKQKRVSTEDQVVGIAEIWGNSIKEGYDYTTTNGARITIWVDKNNQPYVVTYLLKRFGTDSWSSWPNNDDSTIRSIVEQIGISLDGSENFLSGKDVEPKDSWYPVKLSQTFKGTPLASPYIMAEIEGSTGEVNFIKICRWYSNLDKISSILSDEELKERAINYYKSSDEVISIPDADSIRIDDDLFIINDTLCASVGSAPIDEHHSTMDLVIDIQSGKIIDVIRIWCG